MGTGSDRPGVLRIAGGVVLGWVTSSLVLAVGFTSVRAFWPDYLLAEPEKAYSLAMLFVRLVVFSSMIAATSAVATLVSGDKRLAWVAGALIFTVSVPPHLYPGYVWDDYPAWYHIVYLLSIVPIAVFAGRFAHQMAPSSSRVSEDAA